MIQREAGPRYQFFPELGYRKISLLAIFEPEGVHCVSTAEFCVHVYACLFVFVCVYKEGTERGHQVQDHNETIVLTVQRSHSTKRYVNYK